MPSARRSLKRARGQHSSLDYIYNASERHDPRKAAASLPHKTPAFDEPLPNYGHSPKSPAARGATHHMTGLILPPSNNRY